MTTQPTTTDAAIAQAFRERFNATSMTLEVGLELQNIHNRAAELSTETPAAAHGGSAAAVGGDLEREEREHMRTIGQRDDAHEVIDSILDLVLGSDRPEWSSAYGFRDAVEDVAELMATTPAPPVGGFVVDDGASMGPELHVALAYLAADARKRGAIGEAVAFQTCERILYSKAFPSLAESPAIPAAQPSAKDGVSDADMHDDLSTPDLLAEAERIAANQHKDGRYAAALILRILCHRLSKQEATAASGLVDGVNGECVECGTDPETGDIRIIIKTTMGALRDGPPLVYRDVTVSLREAAIGREVGT